MTIKSRTGMRSLQQTFAARGRKKAGAPSGVAAPLISKAGAGAAALHNAGDRAQHDRRILPCRARWSSHAIAGRDELGCEGVRCSATSRNPGVLVLSAFAGAAEELAEAIITNPHDADAIADALHQALQTSSAERRKRHGALWKRVHRTSARAYCERFLSVLRTGE
jgi:hypothetical protein